MHQASSIKSKIYPLFNTTVLRKRKILKPTIYDSTLLTLSYTKIVKQFFIVKSTSGKIQSMVSCYSPPNKRTGSSRVKVTLSDGDKCKQANNRDKRIKWCKVVTSHRVPTMHPLEVKVEHKQGYTPCANAVRNDRAQGLPRPVSDGTQHTEAGSTVESDRLQK